MTVGLVVWSPSLQDFPAGGFPGFREDVASCDWGNHYTTDTRLSLLANVCVLRPIPSPWFPHRNVYIIILGYIIVLLVQASLPALLCNLVRFGSFSGRISVMFFFLTVKNARISVIVFDLYFYLKLIFLWQTLHSIPGVYLPNIDLCSQENQAILYFLF